MDNAYSFSLFFKLSLSHYKNSIICFVTCLSLAACGGGGGSNSSGSSGSGIIKSEKEFYDSDADGRPESVKLRTYDKNGNITNYKTDDDLDNQSDYVATYTYTYTYDENGNILSSLRQDSSTQPDRITTYEYNGSLLIYEQQDYDADGNLDAIITYSHDESGNIIEEGFDYDLDGNFNRVHNYTYDTNGNKSSLSLDLDVDGNTDQTISYTYNIDGNLLTSTVTEGNRVTGGRTYEYDENGHLIAFYVDHLGDGKPNWIIYRTNNKRGDVIKRETDRGADGTIEFIYTYEYKYW